MMASGPEIRGVEHDPKVTRQSTDSERQPMKRNVLVLPQSAHSLS